MTDGSLKMWGRRAKDHLKGAPATALALSRMRALLQENTSRRSLAQAQRQVAQRGVTVPASEPEVRAALRARLHARGLQPVSKSLGDLHVFLLYGCEGWTSILPRALAPFGEVTEFDHVAAGYRAEPGALAMPRRDELEKAIKGAFFKANARRPVDVVVAYASGFWTTAELFHDFAAAGAVTFNFCWDDKPHWPGKPVGGRYPTPAEFASEVDLNLTNAPESVVRYAAHGGLAMFWPEAAHPEVHRPYPGPFELDVSFVGARYGQRPAFIERLQSEGIRVACFGHGWPDGSLSEAELVRLYSRSRINLGFAGIGHSMKLMCLKGRDFEVPMSGGLYLTQDNPELALVYRVGEEIVTYRDARECATQIRGLLADPERANAIRQAGRTRALRDHSYLARWSSVFEMAGVLRAADVGDTSTPHSRP